jgi:hypothetical protein
VINDVVCSDGAEIEEGLPLLTKDMVQYVTDAIKKHRGDADAKDAGDAVQLTIDVFRQMPVVDVVREKFIQFSGGELDVEVTKEMFGVVGTGAEEVKACMASRDSTAWKYLTLPIWDLKYMLLPVEGHRPENINDVDKWTHARLDAFTRCRIIGKTDTTDPDSDDSVAARRTRVKKLLALEELLQIHRNLRSPDGMSWREHNLEPEKGYKKGDIGKGDEDVFHGSWG